MLILSHAPTRLLNQITHHIGRTIGPSPMVFHEMLDSVHLDLHIIPPQSGPCTPGHPHGRNFFTIVTSGLAAAALRHAGSGGVPRCAELMISLPANWPGLHADGTFGPEVMQDELLSWPIRLLKNAARMCLDQGPTVGEVFPCAFEAGRKVSSTPFSGAATLLSALHPLSKRLVAHDDFAISFLALWPLYERELSAGLSGREVGHALACRGITDLIDVERPPIL